MFFISDAFWNNKGRAIVWHAFLASPLKCSGVTSYLRKTEKNSKIVWFLRYLKKFLHEGLSTEYLTEKNYRDFRTVNFGLRKLLPQNWVFSIFAKKSNKKFVFLENDGIVWNRKISWIFGHEVRGKQKKITAITVFLEKSEKNCYTHNFRRIFKKNFGRTCLLLLVVPEAPKKSIQHFCQNERNYRKKIIIIKSNLVWF